MQVFDDRFQAESGWNCTTNIFSQDSQFRGQEQTRKSLNMKQAYQLLENGPSVFGTMADAI